MKMRMKRIWAVLWGLCFSLSAGWAAEDFVWKSGQTLHVACDSTEAPVVKVALDLLDRDGQAVLSGKLACQGAEENICVGTWGNSERLRQLAKAGLLDTADLCTHAEAFLLTVLPDGKLVVAGSDRRGTAYGVLEISRLMGVSPWEWWADAMPEKREEFRLPSGFRKLDYSRVPYRGIFINDEDWGLTPWSWKHYEPSNRKGQIGPATHARIFELLLRLRANTFWPAMHECSIPFFFTEGNQEMADKYAIYLGTSHCEPMMRNTNGEWKTAGKGAYDYVHNRKNVLAFWEERVKQLRHSDDIYTLGMRGVHDGRMQGAETLEEQKKALTDILADQRRMLSKYKGKDLAKVPQVLIPYKEVLDVYQAGLQVPEDVTLMWCDDNYGYITHFPTAEEAARPGGNGIYYHVSYWGRPHDYLWLSTTSPYLLYQQMKLAYDKGIRKMWILNVGDIKPAEYQIELFMDMAWNIGQVQQTGVTGHLAHFLTREFGAVPAASLLPLLQEHYRLAYIRKPEFMGNTRTEEKDPQYKVVKDLPWSEPQIRQRLSLYQSLEERAETWGRRMSEAKRTAYFHLVQYPVQGAAQMNKKCLYAQLARHGRADWRWSTEAFDSIVSLTRRYNQGKWNGFMDYQPRRLAVYQPIPKCVAADSLPVCRPYLFKWNGLEALEGNPVPCEGLGYEGMAAGIPKDTSVVFEFDGQQADSVEIELRLLPSHPVEGDDLRVQVSLDGNELAPVSYRTYGRSEEWKRNVLSNQAVRSMKFLLPKRSRHRLVVKALDEGVVLDQLYVYGRMNESDKISRK